jgi:anti-sigma regulatory factor (Ser/Thr protein kinase)
MDNNIGKLMTKNPKTFLLEDTMDFMTSCFKRFKYGRFPVVDDDNKLKGIITKNDILYSILQKFQLIHSHDKKIEDTLNKPISLLSDEIFDPSEADFLYIIKENDIDNAGIGAAKLKDFLLKQNFDSNLVRRIGVSVYEAEVNVIIHSKSSGKIKCFIKDDHIFVRVEDYGIGIENTQQAMLEGYTTAPDYIREIGFGAGMGLPNMKRCSDKMVILSQKDKGTTIDLYFFIKKQS